MTTKEKIEVMQAFDDGKTIEMSLGGKSDWEEARNPQWNWLTCLYRVKTAPASQLDRIKAEYGWHEVVELVWEESLLQIPSNCAHDGLFCHTAAQSMKGFQYYVYNLPESRLFTTRDTTICRAGKTAHPVAVLFTKDKS